MTTTATAVLTTARPRSAAIAWATPDAIFIEYPHRDGGAPFICRYPKTIDGLAKALNVLVEYPDIAPTPQAKLNEGHAAIKRPQAPKALVGISNDQRDRAHALLKKLGKL